MIVLVTGGTGYIGSHACVELMVAGHTPVLYDNLSNSTRDVVDRLEAIMKVRPLFVDGDVRDTAKLVATIRQTGCEAVCHFAGLKSVAESMDDPVRYYDVNVGGSLRLLEAMRDTGVTRLIFSSSATVYGAPRALPMRETHPLFPINTYGRSKLCVEGLIADYAAAVPAFRYGILRYFNPVGAHETGLIGENPRGVPNNLMPYIAQVAAGQRDCLTILGDDYDTPDGTGVRDYLHVVDLAQGHVHALTHLMTGKDSFIVNLGTGKGYSVKEVLRTFEQVNGISIPTKIGARRAGDLPIYYADADKAQRLLGWTAKKDLAQMCRDSWNAQRLL